MKKVIIILAIVLSCSAMAYAGNGNKIHSVISKQLQKPSLLFHNKLNEKVNVEFKINKNGKASVLNVETKNPELKNYVISEFDKINFKDVTEQEEVYFIDINFKVL